MDKNTVTGLVLIGLLLAATSYFSRPTDEQRLALQQYNDSIALVQKTQQAKLTAQQAAEAEPQTNTQTQQIADSTALFYDALKGTEQLVTLSNNKTTVVFNSKGGMPVSATFAEHKDQEGNPLQLFDAESAKMNFYIYGRKEAIQTKDCFFEPVAVTDSTVTMRLAQAGGGYIDFAYSLRSKSYMIDLSIQAHGLIQQLASTDYLNIDWFERAKLLEKDYDYSQRYSKMLYKKVDGGTSSVSVSGTKVEEKRPEETLNWVAYKNRFFSAIMISDSFLRDANLSVRGLAEQTGNLKEYNASFKTPFDPTGVKATQMHIYYGPNNYKLLKAFDNNRADSWDLEQLVDLGIPVIRQVNEYLVLNLFDWLSKCGLSMGIIILLMTVIIKTLIYPATRKSYMSGARMRVLKPQIEEINKKYPNQDDAMKKQQETMGLYKKYGVSPMGGCLPLLLQSPILFAMFMFVPTAIDFRQQSFLWASDLSNYDSFINLPFNVPFLGEHLSLFCVLMTVTSIINIHFTMQQQDTGQNQMPMMKYFQYFMPVMFLFVLNGYPAGLNYYYFISTLFTVIVMIFLRRRTDDKKLLAELEAYAEKNKNKPKSGFSARLEAMQKQQEAMQKSKGRK